jgi:thiosulfate dehydrogenase [quinone] large subunit
VKEQPNSSTLISLIILPSRFVLGWIFWGGGSRRFFYAPEKLDPHATTWLANKLQSAMPGALLGSNYVISDLLQHFWLLYGMLIGFSLLELLSGLGLILGCFTRLCSLVTLFLSITLMISFGWQGGSCMDEWTMAVSTFAMSAVLLLSGSPKYSVDSVLLHRQLFQESRILSTMTSKPLPMQVLKWVSLSLTLLTIIFTISTYNYYRGAIYSHYHQGPVSPTHFAVALSRGLIQKNGSVSFGIYINAGTSSVPTYIPKIELINSQRQVIQTWSTQSLNQLTATQIKNVYLYNKITTGPYGLIAPESAKALITLPSTIRGSLTPGNYLLEVSLIDNTKWRLPLTLAS